MITENNYCLVNNISLENTMTIRELSKLINVSPATISIVINEKKGVSEEIITLSKEKELQKIKMYWFSNITEAVFLLKKIKGL